MLRDVVGHHLGYNLALASAAVEQGWEPILVSHREFPGDLAAGNRCRPVFRTDWRAAPPVWSIRRMRLLRLLEHLSSRRFGSDLARLHGQAGADDILFVQMLAPRHFVQWLHWHAAQSPRPHLIMHLGYQPARFGTGAVKTALAGAAKVHLVTDSEKLAPAFAEVLGKKVHYLPHVISYDIPAPTDRPPGRPPVLLSLGNARREKGFAEIVEAASREAGKMIFRIQCHQPDPESARLLASGPAAGRAIEWIRTPLSDEAYLEQLTQADVLLLPYHLDYYKLRTSGVFCEARVAGKPVVATAGSWLGDRVAREGGGWLVPERDPGALAECLRAIPGGLAEKTREARAIAPGAREEFCRKRFVRDLLALAEME